MSGPPPPPRNKNKLAGTNPRNNRNLDGDHSDYEQQTPIGAGYNVSPTEHDLEKNNPSLLCHYFHGRLRVKGIPLTVTRTYKMIISLNLLW
jgi:hypothetical protein